MRSLEGDICLCSAAALNHFNATASRKGDKAVKKRINPDVYRQLRTWRWLE